MTIEKGDYFTVTRGYEYNPAAFASIFSPVAVETKPQYDRSYDGVIFRAVEVCGPMVAAEVIVGRDFVIDGRNCGAYKHKRISLNTTEVELMTVTPEYLAAIQTGVTA